MRSLRLLSTVLLIGLATLVVSCDKKDSSAKNSDTKTTDTKSVAEKTLRVPDGWGNPSTATADASATLAKNYYVVFDGSGSMGDSDCSGGTTQGRIVPAKKAMIDFEEKLPADANIGLYVFDNVAWAERVALGHGEANRKAYRDAINKTVAGNGTPLGPSLDLAYEALRKESLIQGGYGEYHIVVVTDGQTNYPSGSAEEVMMKAVQKITASPIVLRTIGFCIAEGHPLNQPGKTIYSNAMNPEDLRKGLDSVLAETDSFGSTATFQSTVQ